MQFPEIKTTVTADMMARYSGSGGIHGDDAAARRIGLAGAVVQGGQLAAYLSEMLVRAFGRGYIEGGQIALAFVKTVAAGDEISTRGEATETVVAEGRTRQLCRVWLENQHGETVTSGTASAWLP